jgi:hypothetical protein
MTGRDHFEAVGLDGVQYEDVFKEMEWGREILQ